MKKVWFKRKRYGYGLTPYSWEGWIVTLAYVLGLLLFFHAANLMTNAGGLRLMIIFIIWTALFLAVSFIKGETMRWQWGKPDDGDGI